MKVTVAKVFWSGRSQAVRLPKEFRVEGGEVTIRRRGTSLILDAVDAWPEGYVQSFIGAPNDFTRPAQGKVDVRATLK